MAKINYINSGNELILPQDVVSRAILLKTDAKDKLVRAQMAANPYNPVLDEIKPEVTPTSAASILTPEANPAPVVEQPATSAIPFSSPIDPKSLFSKEEPVATSVEEPIIVPNSVEEPKMVMPTEPVQQVEEEAINPIEALQRVSEALGISMKIVDECLNQLNEKDTQYKKAA